MEVTIRVDTREAERALVGIKNGAPKAITRAINRTLVTVRAAAVKEIAADTALPSRVVRSATEIRNATWENPTGRVVVTGGRLSLYHFKARETKRGVSYRNPGGMGQFVPGAFIRRVKSSAQRVQGLDGHLGVFLRRRPSVRKSVGAWGPNLPIDQLFGPSLPWVLMRSRIRQAMQQLGTETLEKNLAHEVNYVLLRAGGQA
jgi:hypothetical protein